MKHSNNIKKIFNKAGEVITSEKSLNFAKETIKETATESIKTTGRYIIMIIISIVLGIGGLLYLISKIF